MLIQHFSGMRAVLAVAASCTAAAAQAGTPVGGTIVYGPLTSSVPTLGGWALPLLALLVAAMAYRVLRGRVGGRLLAHLLVVGGVAAAGLAGRGLVPSAEASAPVLSLSSPSGASAHVGAGLVEVINVTPVPQKIQAILPDQDSTVSGAAPSPQCTVGLVLPPQGHCYLEFIPDL
jgi:hypothetical protein